MSVIIRPATAQDLTYIEYLVAELGYKPSRENLLARLEPHCDKAVFVAIPDDSMPMAVMEIQKHAMLHLDAPVARITCLVVSPLARRHGLARVLMTRAVDWAHEQGCKTIELTTALHREGAHALYETSGYRISAFKFQKAI